jgi:hypothetical protein
MCFFIVQPLTITEILTITEMIGGILYFIGCTIMWRDTKTVL